jgi:hypothetical protein
MSLPTLGRSRPKVALEACSPRPHWRARSAPIEDTLCTAPCAGRVGRFEIHRTPCTAASADRGSKFPSRRTPYTAACADRAGRSRCHHIPYNNTSPSHACRVRCRHRSRRMAGTPCTAPCVSHARRFRSRGNLCTRSSAVRGSRFHSLHIPCNVLSACRGCRSRFHRTLYTAVSAVRAHTSLASGRARRQHQKRACEMRSGHQQHRHQGSTREAQRPPQKLLQLHRGRNPPEGPVHLCPVLFLSGQLRWGRRPPERFAPSRYGVVRKCSCRGANSSIGVTAADRRRGLSSGATRGNLEIVAVLTTRQDKKAQLGLRRYVHVRTTWLFKMRSEIRARRYQSPRCSFCRAVHRGYVVRRSSPA